jgi:hypothetical protein
MEAKVDIRRLQYLNDRIAQVMDALNQVRLSVHGLQPALGLPQQFGFQQPPTFQQLPYGMGPIGMQHTPFSAWPGVQPQIPFGGLQHSPFGLPQPPFGGLGLQQSPFGGHQQSPLGGQQNTPYGSYSPYAVPGISGIGGIQGQQAGWGSHGWPFGGGGLYHSPIELMEQRLGEQKATDPNRILQTFPLCLAPLSSTLGF